MPRQPHYNLPGLPQHVIQRGNNRPSVFFDDGDYQRYLINLGDIAADAGCQIHTFVLMTNHAHLLVSPTVSNGISKLMQGMGRRYVAYINHSYQRSGTLWEGCYKTGLVAEDNYLLACMRYIEQESASLTPINSINYYLILLNDCRSRSSEWRPGAIPACTFLAI